MARKNPLLSATEPDPLGQLLLKKGLEKKQVAGLYRHILGQTRGQRPPADIIADAIELARTLLGDIRLRTAQKKALLHGSA